MRETRTYGTCAGGGWQQPSLPQTWTRSGSRGLFDHLAGHDRGGLLRATVGHAAAPSPATNSRHRICVSPRAK